MLIDFRKLFPKLRANLNHPYEEAFCFIVGDEHEKEVVFHISNNGSQSSSILDLGTHKTAHPEVCFIEDRVKIMHRIDKYFTPGALTNLDFLNIDLQGAELKALKGIGKLLHQFKWAYLEVNQQELYKGCALVGEIDDYMLKFGFKRVETKWCGNTGWGDALYIK
jgi:FkbM family methyltransferase